MRTEVEIRNAAVNLKLRLQKREVALTDLNNKINNNDLGIGKLIKATHLPYLRKQLEERLAHQWRDRQNYAALRWVLGITDDIDVADLELDKVK